MISYQNITTTCTALEPNMPAKSKAQQRFMGMVHAYQKGELKNASPEVRKAAKSMSKSDTKKMAKTKHKGKPERVEAVVEHDQLRGLVQQQINELRFSSTDAMKNIQHDIQLWSKQLGKVSHQVVKGMMNGVKQGQYDPLDISSALQSERSKMTQPFQADFIKSLWLIVRDKFRKYIPGGKLRR